MKMIISSLLILAVLWSSICIMPILADSSDAAIQSKIDELWNMVGNTYFTKDHSTGCGKKSSGHGCSNCYTPNIVSASWFINLFGNISAYQFPHTYYNNGEQHGRPGYSCFGFASFAEWYIFKSSNSDTVDTYHAGTYEFNYANVSTYAKKGDLIRLHNGGDSGHSVIMISADSIGMQVIHSNWSGTYNCHVRKDTVKYDGSNYDYAYFTISRVQNRNVITEAPSKSIISIEKTEYAVDEIVNFKFDTDGTKGCNVLWIYCPDGSTLYYTDLYDTYSLGFGMSGNFEALVQTWNDVGSKSSEKIKFHIGTPTYAYISLSKHEFAANETITFTLNTDSTPNCNSIWIYYPDGSSKSYTDIGNFFSVKIDTPGNYEALVQAWNSIGAKSSERINFHIGSPTYANIQLPRNEFYVNEPISFYLDTDATPNCNCVWIYCPDGTTLSYTDLDTSLDIKLDKPGNYEAIVQAWNSLGSKQSNRIKFIVTDPNPYTESTVTKSGTKLIIDTKVHNITTPYDILIVGYKNNKFVTIKRVPHDEQNSPYTLEGDIDEIKVMIWDGLSTIKPLCNAEEIPSSKWITE